MATYPAVGIGELTMRRVPPGLAAVAAGLGATNLSTSVPVTASSATRFLRRKECILDAGVRAVEACSPPSGRELRSQYAFAGTVMVPRKPGC